MNRETLGVPEHFQTPRLQMRPLAAGDQALYCQIYTDPGLMRHVAAPLTLDAARRSFGVACRQAAWPACRPWWVMSEIESGADIGVLGMVHREAVAEIGILLLGHAQGRGHGSEVINALIELAFRDPDTITLALDHSSGNAAMSAMMAKLDFVRDEAVGDDGRVRWQLARERWQRRRNSPGLATAGASG